MIDRYLPLPIFIDNCDDGGADGYGLPAPELATFESVESEVGCGSEPTSANAQIIAVSAALDPGRTAAHWRIQVEVAGETSACRPGHLGAVVANAFGVSTFDSHRFFAHISGQRVPLDALFTAAAPAPFNARAPASAAVAASAPARLTSLPPTFPPLYRHSSAADAIDYIAVGNIDADTPCTIVPREAGDYLKDQAQSAEALQRVLAALEQQRSAWAAKMEDMEKAIVDATAALRFARATTPDALGWMLDCGVANLSLQRLHQHHRLWVGADAFDWKLAADLCGAMPKRVSVYVGALAGAPASAAPAGAAASAPIAPMEDPPQSATSSTAAEGHVCIWAAQRSFGDAWGAWEAHPLQAARRGRGTRTLLWLVGIGSPRAKPLPSPWPALLVDFF